VFNVPVPAAHWRFDEVSGSVASDSSGNNNGTLEGGERYDQDPPHPPVWTDDGDIGMCLTFDGTHGCVIVPDDAIFHANEFTVTMWLNANDASITNYFLRYGNNWGLQNENIPPSSKKEWVVRIKQNSNAIQSTYYFVDHQSTWIHCALVVDTISRNVTFYVNGDYVNEGQYDTPFDYSPSDFVIGKMDPAMPGYGWNGMIDDVRFYNSGLSATEIQELFDSYGITP